MNKKDTLTFGIKNCAECENNIRCENCIYNKESIKKISEKIKKQTVKEILQPLFEMADIGTHDENNDYAYVCSLFKNRILARAKKYGVDINESNM